MEGTNESSGEVSSQSKNHFNFKELKKNFILLVITAVLMIIFLEIFLRIFYPQRLYNHCYESDLKNESTLEVRLHQYFGWFPRENYSGCTYQPDTNKIVFKNYNSRGLRLPYDIPYEKGSKKRVLLLGDSFVDGFGLNDSDTISVQLGKELGEGYEVFPLAASGYGTGQELFVFQEEGLKYHPDIVLLFFYQNDFTDTQNPDLSFADKPQMYIVEQFNVNDSQKKLSAAAERLSKNTGTILLDQLINLREDNIYPVTNETILVSNFPTKMQWHNRAGEKNLPLYQESPFSAQLLRYSYIYSLIYHKGHKIISHPKKIKYSERVSDEIDLFIEKEYNVIAETSMFLTFKLFEEFEKKAEGQHTTFVVVNIPEKKDVSLEYQKRFLDQYSDVNESFFEFRKVDRIFSEELPKRNVTYLSLYDLAGNNFDNFYFKTDAHWNPNGVKLSAKYLADQLRERKII